MSNIFTIYIFKRFNFLEHLASMIRNSKTINADEKNLIVDLYRLNSTDKINFFISHNKDEE